MAKHIDIITRYRVRGYGHDDWLLYWQANENSGTRNIPGDCDLGGTLCQGRDRQGGVRGEASDHFQITGRALFRCTDQKRLLLTLAITPKRHQNTRFTAQLKADISGLLDLVPASTPALPQR